MQATKTVGFIFTESTIFSITTKNGIKFYTVNVISAEDAGEYKNLAQLLKKNKDAIICLDHYFDSEALSGEKMQAVLNIIKIHKNQLPPAVSQKINNFLHQKFAAQTFAEGLSQAGLHDSLQQTLGKSFQEGMDYIHNQMAGLSLSEQRNLAIKMLQQEQEDLSKEENKNWDQTLLQQKMAELSSKINLQK